MSNAQLELVPCPQRQWRCERRGQVEELLLTLGVLGQERGKVEWRMTIQLKC